MVEEQKTLRIHKILIVLIIVLVAGLFLELNLYKMGWLKVGGVQVSRYKTVRGYGNRQNVFEPETDLTETQSEYIVKCDLPGMDKEQIKISFGEHYLTLSGKREIKKDENRQGRFFSRERKSGYFYRSVFLPGLIDEKNINVEYNNGVLIIRLPKREKVGDKGIEEALVI